MRIPVNEIQADEVLQRFKGRRRETVDIYHDAPRVCGLESLEKKPLRRGLERQHLKSAPRAISAEEMISLAQEVRVLNERIESLALGAVTGSGSKAKADTKEERVFTPLVASRSLHAVRRFQIKPSIRKGRLRFTCPCCQHIVNIGTELAGSKTRCPQCRSAIKSPDPRRGLSAATYENHVESIYQPERFRGEVLSPRSSVHGLIDLPRLPQVAKVAGFMVLLSAGLLLMMDSILDDTPQLAQKSEAIQEFERTYRDPIELQAEAEAVVEKFMAADGWAAKAAFVRDASRVAPLMYDYYRGGGESRQVLSVRAIATGNLKYGDCEHSMTDVEVQLADFGIVNFAVEHGNSAVIEWESSVGYNPLDWETTGRGPFRVLAQADDYFNFDYDADLYHCVRLEDPTTRELMGYGYIARDTDLAEEWDEILGGVEDPQPLIVDVERDRERKQSKILQILQAGWRIEGDDPFLAHMEGHVDAKQPKVVAVTAILGTRTNFR